LNLRPVRIGMCPADQHKQRMVRVRRMGHRENVSARIAARIAAAVYGLLGQSLQAHDCRAGLESRHQDYESCEDHGVLSRIAV
jgi:hypothetical protein